jgi:hypothetical protein
MEIDRAVGESLITVNVLRDEDAYGCATNRDV